MKLKDINNMEYSGNIQADIEYNNFQNQTDEKLQKAFKCLACENTWNKEGNELTTFQALEYDIEECICKDCLLDSNFIESLGDKDLIRFFNYTIGHENDKNEWYQNNIYLPNAEKIVLCILQNLKYDNTRKNNKKHVSFHSI